MRAWTTSLPPTSTTTIPKTFSEKGKWSKDRQSSIDAYNIKGRLNNQLNRWTTASIAQPFYVQIYLITDIQFPALRALTLKTLVVYQYLYLCWKRLIKCPTYILSKWLTLLNLNRPNSVLDQTLSGWSISFLKVFQDCCRGKFWRVFLRLTCWKAFHYVVRITVKKERYRITLIAGFIHYPMQSWFIFFISPTGDQIA